MYRGGIVENLSRRLVLDFYGDRQAAVRASIWGLVAAVLAVVAWRLPVHWRSTPESWLALAAQGTVGVAQRGLQAVTQGRIAEAAFLFAAGQAAGVSGLEEVSSAISGAPQNSPQVTTLGGTDAVFSSLLVEHPAPVG